MVVAVGTHNTLDMTFVDGRIDAVVDNVFMQREPACLHIEGDPSVMAVFMDVRSGAITNDMTETVTILEPGRYVICVDGIYKRIEDGPQSAGQ